MSNKPVVLLATTPTCPHCPAIKRLLQQLNAREMFAELHIIDISQSPEFAEQNQIRSVPWLKMGELQFNGVLSLAELEYWASHANSEEGIRKYISNELENGRLGDVEQQILAHPDWLRIAINLLAEMETPMQTRIGLSALIEGLSGQELLNSILPTLQLYAEHDDQRVRCDACHFLGHIRGETAKQTLQRCLHDPDPEVREIAQESLALFH